jgi:hypothetical protein
MPEFLHISAAEIQILKKHPGIATKHFQGYGAVITGGL